MKKYFIFLTALLAVALSSCQSNDDEFAAGNNGLRDVTFTVNIPEAMETRAGSFGTESSSALGGITNLKGSSAYNLRYKLAVYEKQSDASYKLAIPATAANGTLRTINQYSGPQTFSLRLAANGKYKVVVWADFTSASDPTKDLHYATECLDTEGATGNITCKDAANVQLNDESRDAYYINDDFDMAEHSSGISKTLVLRRPWAKVRVVTTDWGAPGITMPKAFKITYKNCKRFKNLNPVTAVSEADDLDASASTVYTGAALNDAKEYSLDYDMHDNNRTLTVDYLMTDKDQETAIQLLFEAFTDKEMTDGNKLIAKEFETDIPIKRNWLTTILGNLLTKGGTFTVEINENFINEWVDAEPWWDPTTYGPLQKPLYTEDNKTYHIYTRNELAWLAANPSALGAGVTFRLEEDIDMNNINWQPLGHQKGDFGGACGTFDGNNHVLRNFKIEDKYAYGTMKQQIGVFGEWHGTIKNLTFENITINGLYDSKGHGAFFDPDGKPLTYVPATITGGDYFEYEDGTHFQISGNDVTMNDFMELYGEFAYYAGPVAYFAGTMENVHAKHVFIRGLIMDGSDGTDLYMPTNVGGLIGYTNSPFNNEAQIKNCSAEDVHILGVSQAGGLVGSLQNGWTLENCSTDYVYMRAPKWHVGRFIGDIVATSSKIYIKKCTPASDDHTFFLDIDGNAIEWIEDGKPYYGGIRPKYNGKADEIIITN